MNNIFRIVWSEATQTWVAVSELTKAHKKKGSSKGVAAAVVTAALGLGVGQFAAAAGDGALEEGRGANAAGSGAIAYGRDSAATQTNSVAIGVAAKSTALKGVALGSDAEVTGNAAQGVAIGAGSQTEGAQGLSFGVAANAKGKKSIAIGSGDVDDQTGKAKNDNSNPIATGDYSVAFGSGAQALKNGAMAFGFKSYSAEINSLSFGNNAHADADSSIAIGSGESILLRSINPNAKEENATTTTGAVAGGKRAIAMGRFSRAGQDDTIAIGSHASTQGKSAVAIGGSGSSEKKDVAEAYKENSENAAQAYADYAVAVGYKATANQANAVAISESYAGGQRAVAAGKSNAYGNDTVALAGSTANTAQASKNNTVAIGGSTAKGENTVAIGGSNAYTDGSFAAAGGNTATMDPSALGGDRAATATGGTGKNQVAIGGGSNSNGEGSVAIGGASQAVGDNSIAMAGGKAVAQNGVALGKSIAGGINAFAASGGQATENHAIAIGHATASSVQAIALGDQATAGDQKAVAIGTSTQAELNALAAGNGAKALSQGAVALGNNAQAGGAPTIKTNDKGEKVKVYIDPAQTSTAIGNAADARQGASVAIGSQATVYNGFSVAVGNGAVAGTSGKDDYSGSTAIGQGAKATGNYSTAVGKDAKTGDFGSALGKLANAAGTAGVAVGTYAETNGYSSIAIGGPKLPASGNVSVDDSGKDDDAKTKATADESIAVGAGAQATSGHAIALGLSAKANKADGVALGASSETTADKNTDANAGRFAKNNDRTNKYSGLTGVAATSSLAGVSVGSTTQTRQINNLSAGTRDTDAVNVAQLRDVNLAVSGDGNSKGDVRLYDQTLQIVGGDNVTTKVEGNKVTISTTVPSVSAGPNIKYFSVNSSGGGNENNDGATGNDAIAIGKNAQSQANGAIAMGWTAVVDANAGDSIAIGSSTQTKASETIAMGKGAKAQAQKATAIGTGANAVSNSSIALGEGATINGGTVNDTSHSAIAIGRIAKASGLNSIALGVNTETKETKSVAIGSDTKTGGANATAVGAGANAATANSIAMGNNTLAGVARTVEDQAKFDTLRTALGNQEYTQDINDTSLQNSAQYVSAYRTAVQKLSAAEKAELEKAGIDVAALQKEAAAMTVENLGSAAHTEMDKVTKLFSGNYPTLRNFISAANSYNSRISAATANSAALTKAKQKMDEAQAELDKLTGSVALGNASAASGERSTAIGIGATATGNNSLALGYGSAVEFSVNSTADNVKGSTAIGQNARVQDSANSIALGTGAMIGVHEQGKPRTNTHDSIAIGSGANTLGSQNIVIGKNASAFSSRTDLNNEVHTDVNAVAIGTNAYVFDNAGVAIGQGARVNSHSGTVGAIGGVALGGGSVSDRQNSIASLYTSSFDGFKPEGTRERKYITTFSPFTSEGKTNVAEYDMSKYSALVATAGAVSVGDSSVTHEVTINGTKVLAPITRQIINLAAGLEDTDAVNVAQLKSVNLKVVADSRNYKDEGGGRNYNNKNSDGANMFLDREVLNIAGDSSSFTTTESKFVTITDSNKDKAGLEAGATGKKSSESYLQVQVKNKMANVIAGSDGKSRYAVAGDTKYNGLVSGETLNSVANNIFWTLKSDDDNRNTKAGSLQVKAGTQVALKDSTNLTVTHKKDSSEAQYSFDLKPDVTLGTAKTENKAGTAGSVTVNGGSGQIVKINGSDGSLTLSGETKRGTDPETKTVVNDKGITITPVLDKNTNGTYIPSTKKPVSLTQNGLDNGGNKIISVAPGEAGTDAVNVDQLNAWKVKYFSVNSTGGGNEDNKGAKGTDSIAIGKDANTDSANKDNGSRNMAIGNGATVIVLKQLPKVAGTDEDDKTKIITDAIALGTNATTSAKDTVVIGHGANATGEASVSVGLEAATGGSRNIAIGKNASVKAGNGTGEAVGSNEMVDSIAIGTSATASARNTIVIGNGAKSIRANTSFQTGENTIAIGTEADASYTHSIAMGTGAKVGMTESVAIGNQAKGNVRANGNGRASTAVGARTEAEGDNAVAVGVLTKATSGNASAFGTSAVASGGNSTAIGYSASASGVNTVAIGDSAQARFERSIAIGKSALANTTNTMAIGEQAQSTGIRSMAFGRKAQSIGQNSIAFGSSMNDSASEMNNRTFTMGNRAVAIGTASSGLTNSSIAMGDNATAGGTAAQGDALLKAYNDLQTAQANKAKADAMTAGTAKDEAVTSATTALADAQQKYNEASAAVNKHTNTVAIGKNSVSAGISAVALGDTAQVLADRGTALGQGTSVSTTDGVALGAGSSASVAAGAQAFDPAAGRTNFYNNVRGTGAAAKSARGAVDIGGRQITSVAGGTVDTDAVNVAQLKGVALGFTGNSGKGDVRLFDQDLAVVGAGSGDSQYIKTTASDKKIEIDLSDKAKRVIDNKITLTGNSGSTNAQDLDKQGGISFGITGAGTGNTSYITTNASGSGVSIDLSDDAKTKLNHTYNVVGNGDNVTVTPETKDNVTTFTVSVDPNKMKAGNNISITGDGTTASPYVITAKDQVEQVKASTDADNIAEVSPATGSTQGTANATYEVKVSKQAIQDIAKAADSSIASKAYAVDDKGKVTMTYVDGNGKAIADRQATITGVARADMKNITDEGKKVITGLGSIVAAGDRVTVTPKVDEKTGQTTYTVTADKQVESVAKADAAAGDTNIAEVAPITGADGAANTKYGVSVSKNAVKDAAREAVTVNTDTNNTNNPITVTPTQDGTNHTTSYSITFNGDNAAKEIPLTYKANGRGDKTVKLDKGLDFTNGERTVATIKDNGVVTFDLNDDTKSKIDNAANKNLSNITNEGNKVIHNVARKSVEVVEGQNTTVTHTAGSDTTPDKYAVNVQGDLTKVTSITNESGNGKVSFGDNGVITINGGANTDKGVSIDGKQGYVTGLQNREWVIGTTQPVNGRAATEDQLKSVSDKVNEGLKFGTQSTGTNAVITKKLGEQLDIIGGGKENDDKYDSTNIKTMTTAEGKVQIALAKTITADEVKIGKDGKDGVDGKIGVNGKDGASVVINGKDGSIGLTGPKGKDGTNGATTTITVATGRDGKDVAPGTKGLDGTITTRIEYKDGNNTHTIATLDDGMKYAGDDAQGTDKSKVIAKKLNNTVDIIGGAKQADLTDNNIGVNNVDGKLKVQLAKKLNLGADGSVTTGNTTVNNDGMTIKGADGQPTTNYTNNGITITPSTGDTTKNVVINNNGLNNGGNKITNVDKGTADTDAVNVSQLKEISTDLTNKGMNFAANSGTDSHRNLGETLSIKGEGTKVDANYSGENIKTFSDGQGNITVKLDKDIKTTSVTTKTITVGEKGEKGQDGKDGIDGTIGVNGKDGSAVVINGKDGSIGLNGKNGENGLTIKGADGKAGVDGKDGVTRIVYETKDGNNTIKHEVATLDDGQKYGGDNYKAAEGNKAEENVIAKKLNERLDIIGGAAADKLTENNIGVNAKDGKLKVQLAKDLDLTKDGSIKTGNAVMNNDGWKVVNGTTGTSISSDTIRIGGTKDKDGNLTGGITIGDQVVTNNQAQPKEQKGKYVTGLDNKTWTPDTDGIVSGRAATEDQLQAATNAVNTKGLNFKGNAGDDVHKDLGQTLEIVGKGEKANDKYDATNIKTYTENGKLVVALDKDIKTTSVTTNTITVGEKGEKGQDGKAGKDGVDGTIGVNGKDGSAVVINGKDGSIGLNGKDGKNGLTIKGADGKAGVDGKDGVTRIVYETKDGNNTIKHEVATLDDGQKYGGDNYKAAEGNKAEENVIAKKLNERLDIIGGADADKLTDKNIGVNAKDGKLKVQLAKNLTDIDTITVGKDGKDGVNGTIIVKGKDGAGVQINGEDGTIGLDGRDGKDGLTIASDKGAAGVDGTDGANGKDGMTRIVYTDNNNTTHEVATLDDGLKFTGNNSDTTNIHKLNSLVTIEGEGVDKEASKVFKSASGNINVVADGTSKLTVQLSKNLTGLDTIDVNTVTVGKDGKDGVNGTIIVKGKDGAGVQINGEDGTIGLDGRDGKNGLTIAGDKGAAGVDGTDGANGKDGMTRIVYTDNNNTTHEVATLDDGMKYAGDDGQTDTTKVLIKKLNNTVDIVGGADKDKLTDKNIGVNNVDGKLKVQLAKNLTDIDTITVGKDGKDGVNGTIIVKGKDGAGVQINGEDGTIGLDGRDGKDGLTIASDKGAAGVDGTDGANGKDGMTRIVYTDNNNTTHEVATLDDGLKFTGNNSDTTNIHKLNSLVTIEGEGVDKEASKAFKSASGNINVVADGTSKLTVQLSKNLTGLDTIDVNTVTVGKDGKDGVNGTIIVKGKDGAGVQINGEDGTIGLDGRDGKNGLTIAGDKGAAGVDGTDGANGKDGMTRIVYTDNNNTTHEVATLDDGLKFTGNNSDTTNIHKLNSLVTIEGEGVDKEASKVFKSASGNINVVADGTSKLTVQLSKNLTGLDTIDVNTVTVGKDGKDGVNGTIIVKGKDGAGVQINGEDGTIGLDGRDGKNGLTIAGDKGAAGVDGTDGANGKDGMTRIVYTDNNNTTHEVATLDDGLKFTGNNSDTTNIHKLNSLVTIEGEGVDKEASKVFKSASGNINVVADGTSKLTVQLSKNLTGLDTIDVNTVTVGKDGKDGVNGTIIVKGKDGAGVQINGEDGTIGLDGRDGKNGLTIAGDKGAAGVDGTDGANGKDGMTRIVYTDNNNTTHEVATLDDGMKYAGDDGQTDTTKVLIKKLNNTVDIVGGADKDKLTDNNIGVNNVDGKLKVQLAKNIDLGNDGSVKTGNTTMNNGGVTVDDGNGNSTTITINGTTVKAGDISTTTTAGATTYKDGDKVVTVDTNGTTIVDGDNVVTHTAEESTYKNADGSTTITAGNATFTDGKTSTILGPNGVTITPSNGSELSVSLTDNGLNNGGNKITNVAKGTDDTDAVNVSQLKDFNKDITEKGLNFAANSGDVSHRNLGETLTIKGEGTKEDKNYSGENLKTMSDGKGNITIKMDKDITTNSVTTNTVTVGKDGKDGVNGTIIVKGKDGAGVQINGEDGTIGLDGRDGKDGLTIASDKGAAGVDGTDGANGKDGMTRIVYTDNNNTTHEVATLDDGLKFTGNNSDTTNIHKLNSLVTIEGEGVDKEASKVFKSASGNINVVADGTSKLTVQLSKNLTGLDTIDVNTVTVGKDGKDGVNGTIIVKGKDGAGVQINGEDGTIGLDGRDGKNGLTIAGDKGAAGVDGTDGANGKDGMTRIVYTDNNNTTHEVATLDDGLKFTGNNSDTTNIHKLNSLVTIEGEGVDKEASKAFKSASGNINVVADGTSKLTVQLSKNLTGLDTIDVNTVTVGKDGKDGVNGTIIVKGKDGAGVQINGEDGTIGLDGRDGKNGLTIAGDKGAAGVDGTDGANGKDGMTRIVYTDNNNTTHEVATLDDGMKYAGDDAQGTDKSKVLIKKLNNTVDIVGGADKDKLTDNNIGVNNVDGKLKVQLAKNIDLGNDGSVKTGNTTMNNGGVTVDDGNGNSTTITINGTTVKAGDISTTTTAGATTYKDGDKVVTVDTTGTTIVDGDNVVTHTAEESTYKNRDGSTTITAGNATFSDGKTSTILGPNGVTITPSNGSELSVSLTDNGLNNGGNKITNVAKGTDDTDAVNVSQLKDFNKDITEKGLNFAANSGDVSHRNLGETLTIKGEGTKEDKNYSGENLKTMSDGKGNITIKMDKDITTNSVTTNTVTVGKDGKDGVNGTIIVKGKDGAGVQINGEDGTIGLDGRNGKDGLTIAGDKGAAGVDGTDGANGKDGMTRIVYTDNNNTTHEVATLDDGLKFTGNNSHTTNIHKLNSLVTIEGEGVDKEASKVFKSASGNINVVADGTSKLTVQLSKNLTGIDTIDVNTVTVGKDGKDGVNGTIIVKGKDGAGVQINGEDGTIGLDGRDGKNGLTIAGDKGAAGVDGTDGANGKDGMTRIVYTDNNNTTHEVATLDDGMKYAGDDAQGTDKSKVLIKKLNNTVDIVGGADKDKLTDKNIGVNNVDGKLKVQLSKELKDLSSAQFKDKNGNTTEVTGEGMTITDGNNHVVIHDANGTLMSDGKNSSLSTANGYSVMDDKGNVAEFSAGGTTISDGKGNSSLHSAGNSIFTNGDVSTIVGPNGITITPSNGSGAEVTLTDKGLNNGGNKITGVAAGDISPTSTDAVNGSQLYKTTQEFTTKGMNFVGNDKQSIHKNLGDTMNIIGGGEKANTEYDASNVKTFKDDKGNLVVGLDKNLKAETITTKTVTTETVNTKEVKTDALTINGKDGKDGVTIKGETGKDGETRIVYTDGKDGKDGKSHTVATLDDGMKFAGDDKKVIDKKLGEQLDIHGGADANNLTDNNIGVVSDNKALKVKLAKNIKGVDSISKGEGKGGITLQDKGVRIDGGDLDMNNHKVTNVAPGRVAADSKDAVNGSQLHATNQVVINNARNIAALDNKINHVDRNLRAGIAGALASGGLYQANTPGKSMVSAGVGTYKGESAVAVGYSRMSDNGKIGIKFSVNSNTRGDNGAAASVGYQW